MAQAAPLTTCAEDRREAGPQHQKRFAARTATERNAPSGNLGFRSNRCRRGHRGSRERAHTCGLSGLGGSSVGSSGGLASLALSATRSRSTIFRVCSSSRGLQEAREMLNVQFGNSTRAGEIVGHRQQPALRTAGGSLWSGPAELDPDQAYVECITMRNVNNGTNN